MGAGSGLRVDILAKVATNSVFRSRGWRSMAMVMKVRLPGIVGLVRSSSVENLRDKAKRLVM